MTAFNCASYLSLGVQRQRDGLDLLRRGGSSHRPQGNLGLSTSLYTPCIVRFCSLEPNHFCLLPSGSRLHYGEGTFLRVDSVSGPPTPSKSCVSPYHFNPTHEKKPLTGRGSHRVNEPPALLHKARSSPCCPELQVLVLSHWGGERLLEPPHGGGRTPATPPGRPSGGKR